MTQHLFQDHYHCNVGNQTRSSLNLVKLKLHNSMVIDPLSGHSTIKVNWKTYALFQNNRDFLSFNLVNYPKKNLFSKLLTRP